MRIQDLSDEQIALNEIGGPAGLMSRAANKVKSKVTFGKTKNKAIGELAMQAEANRLWDEYWQYLGSVQQDKPTLQNLSAFFNKAKYGKTATEILNKKAEELKPDSGETRGEIIEPDTKSDTPITDQLQSKNAAEDKRVARQKAAQQSADAQAKQQRESYSLIDVWNQLNEADSSEITINDSEAKKIFMDVVKGVAQENPDALKQRLATTGSLDKAKQQASQSSDSDEYDDEDGYDGISADEVYDALKDVALSNKEIKRDKDFQNRMFAFLKDALPRVI